MSISSLNGRQPAIGMSAYCSAKAGLSMLTQVAALELAPRGIRVNAVAPGFVHTPLTEGAALVPGVVEEYVENTPLGRAGTPEDIAEAVLFLTKAAWLTGEVLDLNGGAHLKRYPDIIGHLMKLARSRHGPHVTVAMNDGVHPDAEARAGRRDRHRPRLRRVLPARLLHAHRRRGRRGLPVQPAVRLVPASGSAAGLSVTLTLLAAICRGDHPAGLLILLAVVQISAMVRSVSDWVSQTDLNSLGDHALKWINDAARQDPVPRRRQRHAANCCRSG